ncbi:MAG: hypothetical protein J6Y02_21905 [Pseudobutyrivibrio sp.]|nr:hypothetical protein [Pseudobutyrivibrio sp.]
MNVVEFIVNVTAIFSGLFIYIGAVRSKWGKEHTHYQYLIMLGAVVAGALIGGILRWLIVVR